MLAAVVLSVFFALPASAADAGGAADAPRIEVPGSVSGRNALTISVAGVDAAITVDIRDAAGSRSSWRFPAGTTSLVVDLSNPASGSAPVNGEAVVSVTTEATGPLAQREIVVDRDPSTPSLTTVVRGQRVGLFWNAVDAADTVTYKLERTGATTAWQVISESTSVGYTERNLAPGRYRYRLTASVPGSDGSPNVSGASAAQIRIVAPTPTLPPTPSQPADAGDGGEATGGGKNGGGKNGDNAGKGSGRGNDKPADSRDVTATGDVRGPVQAPKSPSLESAPGPRAPLVRGTADSPAVTPGMPATQTLPAPAPVATPEIAPASPSGLVSEAPTPSFDYFPVTVPPAGALAVESAGSAHALSKDAVTLLTGITFMGLAATGVRRRRRSSSV